VIVPMERIRVLAPRSELEGLLAALQDAGVVHPVESAAQELPLLPQSTRWARLHRQLGAALADADDVLAALAPWLPRTARRAESGPAPLPALVRAVRRVRRQVDVAVRRRDALRAEEELLARYRPLLDAFAGLAAAVAGGESLRGHLVLLREGGAATLERLRGSLAAALDDELELRAQELAGGEVALLVLVPARLSAQLEELLAGARVEEVTLPALYGPTFLAAVPRMRERERELPGELRRVEEELRGLAREHGDALAGARARLHDRLSRLELLPLLRATGRAVVMEGWAPSEGLPRLQKALDERLGGRAVLEPVAREQWRGEEAPVVLRNPRLFRPFEALVRPFPLPRYGTIDPTPFVAIFFPMLFGLILGDLGYAAMLAALAALVGRRQPEGTLRHSVARIGGACALFAAIFGVLYGELFGDLGRTWLGLRPLIFDREEAVVPFLVLAVSLGFVHLLLGMVVGAIGGLRRSPRHALGRGLAALMLLLVACCLLAAFEVLPARLFHPAVIALLVVFPVLVAVEGVVAPIELLSTLGHVLSYARIMAIGTASVMLAVVANRMVGALGSVLVGSLFALLFHLVNFALGVFSPTLHALRLHYVEFFGTFYSPGGQQYRPLAHWRAAPAEH
jgi:V/A-type H+-transporting ATPase subunit I